MVGRPAGPSPYPVGQLSHTFRILALGQWAADTFPRAEVAQAISVAGPPQARRDAWLASGAPSEMMSSAKYHLFLLSLLLSLIPSAAVRESLLSDGPATVHAFYAADEPQIDGLSASIHSLLVSCSQPQRLVVDVAVKAAVLPAFQAHFGMKDKSLSVGTTLGATIRLHALDEVKMNKLFKYQSNHYHERASLAKSIEKYARLFLDGLLPDAIVVYLDTDVVVQADVLVLADRFAASGKTMAFVVCC